MAESRPHEGALGCGATECWGRQVLIETVLARSRSKWARRSFFCGSCRSRKLSDKRRGDHQRQKGGESRPGMKRGVGPAAAHTQARQGPRRFLRVRVLSFFSMTSLFSRSAAACVVTHDRLDFCSAAPNRGRNSSHPRAPAAHCPARPPAMPNDVAARGAGDRKDANGEMARSKSQNPMQQPPPGTVDR